MSSDGLDGGKPTISTSGADVADVFGIPQHDDVAVAFGLTATATSPTLAVDNTGAMDDLIASELAKRPAEDGSNAGEEGTQHAQPMDDDLEAGPSMSVDKEGHEEEVGYVISAVQIKPSMVFDTLSAPPPPQTVSDDDSTPSAPPTLPTKLPEMMNMPLGQRCDFCIKFDSVCSTCHFKWKGFLEVKKKALMHSITGLPDADKTAILLATMAKGSADFAKVALETSPYAHATVGPFSSLASDDCHPELDEAGLLFPLHVACAYDRVDMATALLDAGAKVQRSEARFSPFHFLLRPPEQHSLTDEWETALENRDVYIHHTMVERAKELRKERRFEDAQMEYDAILEQFPNSEGAQCGVAKMYYDMGEFTECLRRCEEVLSKRATIEWIEFSPVTIVELKENALKARHEKHHPLGGPSLKPCGCVVTDATVISLRRLPFLIIARHILPFACGMDLYQLFKATNIPLLRIQTELVASQACDLSIGTMLSQEFGYEEMYEAIAADQPQSAIQFGAFQKFLGLQVVAMGDFHTFILRAGARVENPRYKKKDSWFGKKENKEKPTLVAIKLFRVHRVAVGKAWDVQESGEWEVADETLDVQGSQ